MKSSSFLKIFLFAAVVLSFNCGKAQVKVNENNQDENIVNNTINIHDLSVNTIDGKTVSLKEYSGKVLLIVNVASKCGYTKQYKELEEIYSKYKNDGFEILAFPCNDFGGQEPGTNEEIKEFCSSNYNITFTLFDKIKVLSEEKNPLYARMINFEPAGDISWNFEKFVIDKKGNVVGRFKSKVKPDDEQIVSLINSELKKTD